MENDSLNKKKTLKNIIMIMMSNCVTVLSGVLVGFLIPKIMGDIDYSRYKTFTLYVSYIGVLHFGICDGIYLKYAGKSYDELDKKQFGAFTKTLFLLETIISVLVIFVALIFLPGYYKVTIALVGINILAVNVVTYYELISQLTSRFKLVSMRNVVRSSVSIIVVLVLFLIYLLKGFSPKYYLYTAIVVGINIILAIWYMITYRGITFGKFDKIKSHKNIIKQLFRIGIILLLSNFVSQIIYIIDQQCVSLLFSEQEYGIYAFAYTMVNLLTVATSAIATVLYPLLSTTDEESAKKNYGKLNSYMIIFVSLAMFIYYPLHWFVGVFLSDYVSSLEIFRVILPGIALSSTITVIKSNYYKKLGHIPRFLVYSIVILIISIIANLIAYAIFKTMLSISIASVVTHAIWYIISDLFLAKKYKVNWIKNVIYLILIIFSYYIVYLVPNIYVGGIAYLVLYMIITLLFFNKELLEAFNTFIRKNKGEIV